MKALLIATLALTFGAACWTYEEEGNVGKYQVWGVPAAECDLNAAKACTYWRFHAWTLEYEEPFDCVGNPESDLHWCIGEPGGEVIP